MSSDSLTRRVELFGVVDETKRSRKLHSLNLTTRRGLVSRKVVDALEYTQSGLLECREYTPILQGVLKRLVDATDSDYGSISVYSHHFSDDLRANDRPYVTTLVTAERSAGLLPSTVSSREPRTLKGVAKTAMEDKKICVSQYAYEDPRCQLGEHSTFEQVIAASIPNWGVLTLYKAPPPTATADAKLYTFNTCSEFVLPLLATVKSLVKYIFTGKETLVCKMQRGKEINRSRDHFLAMMSHEIRTPLNSITAMVSLLPEAGTLNEKQGKYVSTLATCTLELTSLLNDILDFSKMSVNRFKFDPRPIYVSDIVQDAIKIAEGAAIKKGLSIDLTSPEGEATDRPQGGEATDRSERSEQSDCRRERVPLLCDRQRLLQVLNNMLSNAVKFTDNGGVKLQVTASEIGPDETSSLPSLPSVASSQQDRTTKRSGRWRVTFTVTDTGRGIPESDLSRIFDMFYQSESNNATDVTIPGTGLGLAISREIVRLMGGRVSVESKVGKGTTFTFFVVLDEYIDTKKLLEDHADALKETKILIVEDETDSRLKLCELLFRCGCVTIPVSSTEEALRYLGYGAFEFDACIVDIDMPNMSGVGLAQELRVKYSRLKVIAMSDSFGMNSSQDYFDQCIEKPVTELNLVPALVALLATDRPTDRREGGEQSDRGEGGDRRPRPRHTELDIVVAEDDESNAFATRELLESLGFAPARIHLASNGLECCKLVKLHRPNVVLMDIRMPIMNGIEATQIIKRSIDPPTVIAVSASVQESDKSKCQLVGFDLYLTKPVNREELKAALQPLVGSKLKAGSRLKFRLKRK